MVRRAEARAAVVAEARVRLRSGYAGLSRDDLSQPLRSDPRGAEEGTHGALAHGAADAPGQGWHDEEWAWSDRRCGLDPRAAGGGRGSCRAGALGRRSAL